ncbi:MAG TPA: IPT/TIG domain-containing protein [Vulgatibacter sp.]
MRVLRSLPLLSLAVAIALAACGGGDDTPGGAGGAGGDGGGGGGGGSCSSPDGKPRACSVDPDKGPEGAIVRIHGVNFPTSGNDVNVKFSGVGVQKPVAVDAEGGTWIDTRVPAKAATGPIVLELDSGKGFVAIEGPHFTVTDDRPAPVLTSLSPSSATEGEVLKDGITLTGTGFRSISVVEMDGVRVDAQYSSSTSIKVPNIPAEKLAKPGKFTFKVINEPPGGGTSAEVSFQVVAALRVVGAEAVGANRIRLTFDKPVNRGDAAPSRNADRVYSVTPGLTVKDAQMDGSSGGRSVFLTTTANQKPDTDYTVTIKGKIASSEGGALRGTTSATFRAFNSTPIADGVFGAAGCGAASLQGPIGLAVLASDLYVTEESGNQVQRISIAGDDPQFQGFYGYDGAVCGYITDSAATASGCPAGEPAGADSLFAPRGAPGVDPTSGDVYVADTSRDRVVRFKAAGAFDEFRRGSQELADKDKWKSPVVLGVIGGQVLVAASDEKIHRFYFDKNARPAEAFGGLGFGAGNFRFNLAEPPADCEAGDPRLECSYDGSGVPSMGWDPALKFAYVSEPGNHRVQRVKVDTNQNNKLASSGAIGAGVRKFGSEMPAQRAGTANGEFTRPSGVAVDSAGFIYVADEASGGRVQRFDSAGNWLRTMSLDFAPGGLVVDGANRLWISDPAGGRLLRFKL